ncbi:unnamed protein product [Ceratitis capitata]|uniref:(Mediterranean fruit fly) hypothetical protein n=1 Tax=Ceratitis capitata TaxID=7213 RepID=A0A811UQ24_CERCA|nr:unnamed protein product [Ceratitis capitata]
MKHIIPAAAITFTLKRCIQPAAHTHTHTGCTKFLTKYSITLAYASLHALTPIECQRKGSRRMCVGLSATSSPHFSKLLAFIFILMATLSLPCRDFSSLLCQPRAMPPAHYR